MQEKGPPLSRFQQKTVVAHSAANAVSVMEPLHPVRERHRRLGDFIKARQLPGGQQKILCVKIDCELFRRSRSDNDGGNLLACKQPGQDDLGRRGLRLSRDFTQDCEDPLALGRIDGRKVKLCTAPGRATGLRVFAAQIPASERAPYQKAYFVCRRNPTSFWPGPVRNRTLVATSIRLSSRLNDLSACPTISSDRPCE